VLEAIEHCEKITGNKIDYTYSDVNRIGDHIWYLSDTSKFKSHYPGWDYRFSLETTMAQIFECLKSRV
jgi:CDP-paratose 2-epimerase